ncbi:glucan endo-1,3-beta-glucosidase 3 [Selaginella moellendorffii]|uniref:glucan endo-1,3-beta-glucosidase 3 n=1 Tax=Selaginella moellendorffii TaxID=88036 RepID=UPI000D1CD216|nr:glucan endo-1,3-beta-glucosidase 3 [Selaginella moellendorffii]|eukprot:XP_002969476.2 glucan endo-1,3-beta-glucosidase 3 [Selaginella moellendorffii]
MEARSAKKKKLPAMASIVLALTLFLHSASGAFVGVSFGTAVSNLPRPEHVCDLLTSMGVDHVRLYDASSDTLAAFAGSGIRVLVALPNNAIHSVAASPAAAAAWLKNNVLAFLPNTNITGIVVGDAVLTGYPIAAPLLVPAMRSLHRALVHAGRLDRSIKITSAHSSTILMGAFPPSRAFFNLSFADAVLAPMLDFLAATDSYFLLDLDPLAIYEQSASITPIEYALFQPNRGAIDATTQLNYTNLFDAIVDAALSAMAAMNHTDVPLVIGAAGWPWKGESPDATIEKAEIFNTNLVEHVLTNRASPMRPGLEVDTYIHELYSEDRKSGGDGGRLWGLFHANQTPVYKLDVSGVTMLRDSSTGNGSIAKTWCVARSGASDADLESALNWACGIGNADCSAIQQGGACYSPDSVASHASYAFNSYFQRNVQGNGTCDFNGCATLTSTDPSYNSCIYSSGSVNSIIPQNSTATPSSSSSSSLNSFPAGLERVILLTAFALVGF